jgi:two-component system, oxyanion-binding sensor
MALETVRAGFIPLADSAPLVVARECGFAGEEGLNLELIRETSWASIRDRLSVGHFDMAHSLAPMPIAANLGLVPLAFDMTVPMALGSGGNLVTVSSALWEELAANGAPADFDAGAAARALASVVQKRRTKGRPPLVFGIVHPYSAHHYVLAYWLAAAGVLPGRDIELAVVPPPLTPAALARGRLDGFCAGEPWGSVAFRDAGGIALTTNANIWRYGPEKVLGMRSDWATADSGRLSRLLRAVHRACVWCAAPDNATEVVRLLSGTSYLDQPEATIRASLGHGFTRPDGSLRTIDGFLNFSAKAATFPWVSHALWLYSQMVRWGQVNHSDENVARVRRTYRPDLYRAALAPIAVAVPAANAKVEGALTEETHVGSPNGVLSLGPDGFFDGRNFDPDQLDHYIDEQRPDLPEQGSVSAFRLYY